MRPVQSCVSIPVLSVGSQGTEVWHLHRRGPENHRGWRKEKCLKGLSSLPRFSQQMWDPCQHQKLLDMPGPPPPPPLLLTPRKKWCLPHRGRSAVVPRCCRHPHNKPGVWRGRGRERRGIHSMVKNGKLSLSPCTSSHIPGLPTKASERAISTPGLAVP